MGDSRDEYEEMLYDHLAMLTSHGLNFVGAMAGAAYLLERDFLGETELSNSEKKEMFRILNETATKHQELMEWSIRERQKYTVSRSETVSKPKLIPVKVPWKISLATPFLKLTIMEFKPEQVEFLARFKSPDSNKEYEHVVTLSFTGVPCFRGASASKEGHVPVDESFYDWSEVQLPPQTQSAERINEWFEQFNQEWRTSNICPDPGMYEVLNSDWSTRAQAEEANYKHYLIIGEEKYVEILAQGWSWKADNIDNR